MKSPKDISLPIFHSVTLLMILICGSGLQVLMFGKDGASVLTTLISKPWMWLVYLLVGYMIAERVFRYMNDKRSSNNT